MPVSELKLQFSHSTHYCLHMKQGSVVAQHKYCILVSFELAVMNGTAALMYVIRRIIHYRRLGYH